MGKGRRMSMGRKEGANNRMGRYEEMGHVNRERMKPRGEEKGHYGKGKS